MCIRDRYCLVTYGEQAKRTAVVAAAKGQKTLHANNSVSYTHLAIGGLICYNKCVSVG